MDYISFDAVVAFTCGFLLVWGMFQAVDYGR